MYWKIYWLLLGFIWFIFLVVGFLNKDFMTDEQLIRCTIWVVGSLLGMFIASVKDDIIDEIKKNKK